ncbi:MAG: lytic transglycosylase domain-containing protein [Methylotenera sp.]|nr:lytic transglycosylase domain-containing protein [Methylotenera sp.]
MKKILLATFGSLYLISFGSAIADVLIDLERTDEIMISNTQLNLRYTLKIEESSLAQETTLIVPNNKAPTSKLPYSTEVISAADETSIEPALIHAVITVESRHNPRARSKKGAYGLMQLMPATANRFKVLDKHDPKQNILAGAKYLRELLNLFNGDLMLALAAYNAGPGAVQKYRGQIPPYRETMDYVPKVLKLYRQYSLT